MPTVAMSVYDTNRTAGQVFGTNKTTLATTNTYTVPNNGKVLLNVMSTTGGTLTVISQKTVDGLAVADAAITMGANAQIEGLGPWPPEIYNDSSGLLHFTVSAATDAHAIRYGA